MILLTHAEEERDVYPGEEALAALRALRNVSFNESGKPLEGEAFVDAARGCKITVGDMKAKASHAPDSEVPSSSRRYLPRQLP